MTQEEQNAAANQSDWFADVLKDWNTGGKNHYIWEGIENVGRAARNNLLRSDTTPEENKQIKDQYKEDRNANEAEEKGLNLAALATKQNLTYAAFGLLGIFLITRD